MNSRPLALSSATTLALLACAPIAAQETATQTPTATGSRTMDARVVPLPAGVSEAMRRAIADRQVTAGAPAPADLEGWLALQRQIDTGAAQAARDYARKKEATYEAMEVGGVPCYLVTPKEIGDRFKDRWLVHLHGGAFVFLGGEACVREAVWAATACKARVLSIDYRRPPVHRFPAAVDDAVAVWREVLERQPAAATALFGTSAGGNLTLATTMKLAELDLPLPGALFVGTPATDAEKVGDSWYTLEGLDPLGRYDGMIRACFEAYLRPEDFANPLASPVRGDVRGFPPTILFTGTRDLLLSDTVRMHRALRRAGVEAQLHVFEGQAHADYFAADMFDAPEGEDAKAELVRFFDTHLAQ